MSADTQLRCSHVLHGILLDGDIIEFKCRSQRCGAKSGVVVLHRFNIHTGDLVDTKMFKDVTSTKEKVK